MHYKSILVVTDLSTTGNEAVRRAAAIAANCGAELRLMCAPVADGPAWPYIKSDLAELARSTANSTGLSVRATSRYASTPAEIAFEANCADLLVLPYRCEGWGAAFFKGESHQRVMRRTRCPVLLTRSNGRVPYEKIVVAVDFNKEAPQLVRHACIVDDRAEIQLFHSISQADEKRLRSFDVSWQVVEDFRVHQEAYVRQRLQQLALSIGTHDRVLTLAMARGEAARQTVLHQRGNGASLIVVGKRRRSAFMEFVCGAVSSRLLAWSSADVLIVPHDHQSSGRAAAKLRIAAEQADGQSAWLSAQEKVQ